MIAPRLITSVSTRPPASSFSVVLCGSRRQPASAPSRIRAPYRGQPDLPGEVVDPAAGQPVTQDPFGACRARALDEVGQLAVDGDLGELEAGADRAEKLHVGGQALAEQVNLARAGEAERRRGRADPDDLPSHGNGLQGGDLEGHADGDGGGDQGRSQPDGPAGAAPGARRPGSLPNAGRLRGRVPVGLRLRGVGHLRLFRVRALRLRDRFLRPGGRSGGALPGPRHEAL